MSAADLDAHVARFVKNFDDHPPPGAPAEDFADKLVQAVKAKLGSRSRPRHTVTATSDEAESFADKLTAAIRKIQR